MSKAGDCPGCQSTSLALMGFVMMKRMAHLFAGTCRVVVRFQQS